MAIEEGKLIRETLQNPHPVEARVPAAPDRSASPEGRALMGGPRSAEEIRDSIEAHRAELALSVEQSAARAHRERPTGAPISAATSARC